jgi:hypothetical protein
MKLTPRDTQINVRISGDLKRIAEEVAEADSRSMSSLIEKLLVDHLRAIGRISAAGNRK